MLSKPCWLLRVAWLLVGSRMQLYCRKAPGIEYKYVQGCAEGNLAAALSKILGVFVGLKGEITPENVKKWNVLRVEVPKDTRHKDRPIVQDIYAALDKFLGARQAHDKVKLKY